jgi:NAD-dependent DNA ligase
MENFKNKCDIAYELGNPIITDSAYESLFGCNASALSAAGTFGASVRPISNEAIQGQENLPFWMGSLNKIKTEKALSLWLHKNLTDKFVVSCKLDGISALYHNNKLYTRGNGLKGTDISIFLNTLRAAPEGRNMKKQQPLWVLIFQTHHHVFKKHSIIIQHARWIFKIILKLLILK